MYFLPLYLFCVFLLVVAYMRQEMLSAETDIREQLDGDIIHTWHWLFAHTHWNLLFSCKAGNILCGVKPTYTVLLINKLLLSLGCEGLLHISVNCSKTSWLFVTGCNASVQEKKMFPCSCQSKTKVRCGRKCLQDYTHSADIIHMWQRNAMLTL